MLIAATISSKKTIACRAQTEFHVDMNSNARRFAERQLLLVSRKGRCAGLMAARMQVCYEEVCLVYMPGRVSGRVVVSAPTCCCMRG